MQSKITGKILFVVPSFSNGGAERVVTVLASTLAEMDVDTHCIVYYQAPNEYPYSEKIKVQYLAGKGEASYQALGLKQKISALARMIEEIHPSYIIPFLPQVGFHVVLATLGKKYRIVQTVRNNPRTDPEQGYFRKIRDFLVACSWRSFVQNQEQLDYYPKFLHKKIEIIPNPVSNQFFKCEHEYRGVVKEVVAMGRLSAQKNFTMIINAAKQIHVNHPDVHFSIYGEGPLKEELQAAIDANNLRNIVTLKGRTTNAATALDSADLFILSSNYEGMPNALLEAMAVGLPCISTNCPTGPADMIDNDVNGKLIQVNDVDGLVKAIEEYMQMGTDCSKIGRKAKAFVAHNYSEDVIAHRFLQRVLCIEDF